MIDVDDYIGLPFESGGRGPAYDCYGLLRLVYAERLGIELPAHTGYAETTTPETAEMIQAGLVSWVPVESPEPWDAVLFVVRGAPNHIGLVVSPGFMLHTATGRDAAIESYQRPYWRSRIEGFYRWQQ